MKLSNKPLSSSNANIAASFQYEATMTSVDDENALYEMMTKGSLCKRKDFLDKEDEAKSHPHRTFYYRKNVNLDKVIESCTNKVCIHEIFKGSY